MIIEFESANSPTNVAKLLGVDLKDIVVHTEGGRLAKVEIAGKTVTADKIAAVEVATGTKATTGVSK